MVLDTETWVFFKRNNEAIFVYCKFDNSLSCRKLFNNDTIVLCNGVH
jgi:hypothetical protein